ncbi:MAG: leucine-rich repeat protein, partial [Muribaculaceae bacterium]|nr:leucine-rich repeat protein [Muribaculaceae bacterium]
MRKILLTFLMFIAAVPLWAYDFEVDGVYYDIQGDSNRVWVTHDGSRNGGCYSGSVTIPYSVTYEGRTYYVDAIFNYAFYNCTDLSTIGVEARLTYIGPRAFYNCTSLYR